MMSTFRRFILTTLALLVWIAPLYAQTVTTSTTLSSAITSTSDTTVNLTSATGVSGPVNGVYTYLYVDVEQMQVVSIVGTTARVIRGVNSTRGSTHVTLATVWVGPPGAFRSGANASIPAGQCLRTAQSVVPVIMVGGVNNGKFYDCLGVTTAGQWVLVSENGPPVLGSTVASPAGVLTPTGTYFKVSGTNAITGITVPAGAAPGFTLYLESTGIWTWTAAGNILTAGTTTAAGRVMLFVWNGTKWAPVNIA